MKKHFRMAAALAAMVCALCAAAQGAPVSDTKYDWSGLAKSVTSESKPEYERAHDIYRWLTENISYDTTYSIYTADETYENKRGVCQGYSELFYRMAEAVGLRVDIITGKTKDGDGSIPEMGHAWVFVYTDGNSGILADPTWGAGGVNNGVFTREPSDRWFHVDPVWMIFSHFPDNEMYQLLPDKVSFEAFARMPRYEPSLSRYGYDGEAMLASALSGRATATPKFYPAAIDRHTSAVKVPLEAKLRVGQNYEFFVRPAGGSRFIVDNEGRADAEWQSDGTVSGVRFMPSQAGTLSIGAFTGANEWTTLVEYEVAQPTAADIANLEAGNPLLSPALTSVDNFREDYIKHYGIDPNKLLNAVKSQSIRCLPVFYGKVNCKVCDAPWNGVLKAGQSYTFAVRPGYQTRLAIINGEDWYMDNAADYAQGVITVTIPAARPGKLKLSAQVEGNPESYSTILEYIVE